MFNMSKNAQHNAEISDSAIVLINTVVKSEYPKQI